MKTNKTPKLNLITKCLIHNFFSELFIGIIDKTRLYHLYTIMFGIIYPTKHKSLREIADTIPGSPDCSNLNKSLRDNNIFYRILYKQAVKLALSRMLNNAKKGTPIYLSIDDTFIEKSNKQKSLDLVFYDGNKKKTGIQAVYLHAQVGKYHTVFAYRLYNPNVRKSKHQLAQEMLEEIKPLIKDFENIYVLADCWYADEKLMKTVINDFDWHWIGGIKCNRKLDDMQVKKAFWWIANNDYKKVNIKNRDLLTTSKTGKLSKFSDKGLFIVTKAKNKYNKVSWRYFYSSDLNIRVQKALEIYSHRWQIENDFWTLKEHLGIQDFRFRKLSTVESYLNVVMLTYVWLYDTKNKEVVRTRSEKIKYGVCDLIAKLRFNLKEHLFEYEEDSIKILVDEFMRLHLQGFKLE